mmetsp:Transcript_110633/g.312874  ORF Transcript_110633/g.312874 Transcript_110633/m.312874 type:complete len:242 (-) Transcript_110633:1061-1786(-)
MPHPCGRGVADSCERLLEGRAPQPPDRVPNSSAQLWRPHAPARLWRPGRQASHTGCGALAAPRRSPPSSALTERRGVRRLLGPDGHSCLSRPLDAVPAGAHEVAEQLLAVGRPSEAAARPVVSRKDTTDLPRGICRASQARGQDRRPVSILQHFGQGSAVRADTTVRLRQRPSAPAAHAPAVPAPLVLGVQDLLRHDVSGQALVHDGRSLVNVVLLRTPALQRRAGLGRMLRWSRLRHLVV